MARPGSGPSPPALVRELMATRWQMMRGGHGLTATEFARAVGLDERSVRRYLEGDRLPPRDVRRAWERVCGLPLGSLDRFVLPSALLGPGVDVPTSDPNRRFVGRTDEVRELSLALARAASGCQLVLIGGEPGVGKSRLAAELAVEAERRGAAVLGGSCDEMLRRPFQPFDRVLRPITGPITELLPEHDPDSLSINWLRNELFHAATTALERIAADVGLLVAILDDLHWAAEPALLLLRHLMSEAPQLPLLIVATYNPTELDDHHPLANQLADLRHAERSTRVTLRGVSEDDVAELLAATRPDEEERRQLARAIHRETEGNPLFVWEMIELVTDSPASDVASLELPEGIRATIGRRIHRRSPTVVTVLTVAAAIGATFDLLTLREVEVLDLDEDELVAALDEAQRARLIDEIDVGRYRFAHGLIRRTLQQETSTTRRAVLHRAVARALTVLGAPAGDVAYHWYEGASGEDSVEAARWLLHAADESRSQSAWEEALVHAQRGLEVLERGPGDAPLEARLLLLLAETPQRGYEQVREWSRRAAEAATIAGDHIALARSAVTFAAAFDVGVGDDESVERCRIALEHLSGPNLDDESRAARALVLSILTIRLVWSGRGGRRVREAIEDLRSAAMDEARASRSRWALDRAYEANLIALEGTPHIDQRLALADARVDLHYARPDPRLRATARLCAGDVAGFDDDAAAFEDNDPWRIATAAHWRAMRALFDGRFDDVQAHADAAISSFEANINFQTVYLTQIFWLHYETGRLDELQAVIDDAVRSVTHFRAVPAAAFDVDRRS